MDSNESKLLFYSQQIDFSNQTKRAKQKRIQNECFGCPNLFLKNIKASFDWFTDERDVWYRLWMKLTESRIATSSFFACSLKANKFTLEFDNVETPEVALDVVLLPCGCCGGCCGTDAISFFKLQQAVSKIVFLDSEIEKYKGLTFYSTISKLSLCYKQILVASKNGPSRLWRTCFLHACINCRLCFGFCWCLLLGLVFRFDFRSHWTVGALSAFECIHFAWNSWACLFDFAYDILWNLVVVSS